MRRELLSVLVLCCQVRCQSGGFNPFEMFQAFSGIGNSGPFERPSSLMNLLMNRDGKPQISVSLGAPKVSPNVRKPEPTEAGLSSASKSAVTSTAPLETKKKVQGTGFEDLELQPNWAEDVDESFSQDEVRGSGEEIENPKKVPEKPVEKKKSYIELAKCFLKYGRENEKLGFCFGLNESATRPFYLASHSNEQLEKNCRGSYDLNEFIKQRSVHKDLETNQLNCEPTLQHHQINVDFEEFERGSVQIIQQWRLVNSTKTETRNFRDETQRFTEIVKVNTEVYGLECIHFAKTNDFWIMNQKGGILHGRNFDNAKDKILFYQFRIDRLRSDGEWGFPLKTGIEEIPAPSSRLGINCELRREHRFLHWHDDLAKAH